MILKIVSITIILSSNCQNWKAAKTLTWWSLLELTPPPPMLLGLSLALPYSSQEGCTRIILIRPLPTDIFLLLAAVCYLKFNLSKTSLPPSWTEKPIFTEESLLRQHSSVMYKLFAKKFFSAIAVLYSLKFTANSRDLGFHLVKQLFSFGRQGKSPVSWD